MKNPIKIKPHHFIDIIMSFSNNNIDLSPHPYGHAVHIVTKLLIENKNTNLEIDLGADDICSSCIHNINSKCDDTIDTSFRPKAPKMKQDWNLQIDQNWCKKLGIKQGDRISAAEFSNILNRNKNNLYEVYKNVPEYYILNKEEKLKKGLKKFMKATI